jgi:hypothetical protein
MSIRIARAAAIALSAGLAATAIAGGIWVIPDLPPEWLDGSPFSSYLVPTLALTVVVGGGALLATIGLIWGRWWAPHAAIATGAAMVIFEIVEVLSVRQYAWLQVVFLGVGATMVALGIALGPERPRRPTNTQDVLPTALSLVAAALLVVTSVAGLAYGARGLYRADPATLPTFIGQDTLTLVVGLPLLFGSMLRAHGGSLRGRLLWLGALFYFAYSYSYYLLSPEFNALYLAYIAIVSASLYGLLALLLTTNPALVKRAFEGHTPVRAIGGCMMGMAVLLALKWSAMLVGALQSGAPPLHKDLVVWVMDLVIALPALFWGGAWLWRRQALGYVVAGMLLVKATFVGVTLVVDTYLVSVWGEPVDPMLPAYVAIAAGGLVLLTVFARSSTSTGVSHV